MVEFTTVTLSPPVNHGGIGRYADQLRSKMAFEARTEHVPLHEEMNASDYVSAATRATRGDIAHVHFEYGLFRPKLLYALVFFPVLFLASRFRREPVVITVHEVWTTETVGRVQYGYVWLVHVLVAMTASRLVFMTKNAEEDFRPRHVSERELIPHGVDIDSVRDIDQSEARAMLDLESGDTVVSQIGFVSRRKGTDDFLELAKRHPEYEFVVAGGPLREEDERYFQQVLDSAPENVRITGVLSDSKFHAAFAATDVAVLAYRDIRQSGILNWCFAYGVTAVCRAIDRFERLTERGAPLVLFGEGYGSIDEALATALDEADDRSRGMREFGAEYDLSSVAARYVELYRTLV
jgi:glycosyltransferase involved in cell wall biosynthesis